MTALRSALPEATEGLEHQSRRTVQKVQKKAPKETTYQKIRNKKKIDEEEK